MYATPLLIGVTTPGAMVELLQADGTPVQPGGDSRNPRFGHWRVHFDIPQSATNRECSVRNVHRRGRCVQQQRYEPRFSPGHLYDSPHATITTRKISSLDPNDDTGIKGDNITSFRVPDFIGSAVKNATVELFQEGT